jgi:mannose-6-phosphate isomerase-like protein (cupin superfamily)
MRSYKTLVGMVAAGAFAAALGAQDVKPSCNRCSGTFISSQEVESYLKRVPPGTGVADQQVRAVNAGKTNVDIGVIYRGKVTTELPVAEHDLVSEVYHVLDGSATLMLGSDIVGAERRPADDVTVRMLNGPGSNGVSIRNGKSYDLKAGDVVIIPAGVGHWFTKINDHIRYIMVRIDPDKVTPLKDEAASQADLRAGFQGR